MKILPKIPSVNYLFLTIGFGFLLMACSSDHEDKTHHQSFAEQLSEKHDRTLKVDINRVTDFDLENFIPVDVLSTNPKFYVSPQLATISSFPCNECHDRPLRQLTKLVDPEIQKAHWQIQLKHASTDAMDCQTCHNSEDMNTLVSLTGKKISLNHSYQQCAQCHSGQATDWIGGAHGKRVEGWIPPRIIKNCVQCHDPHQPGWEKRWPTQTQQVR
ncbi:MAG: hypothetical protein ACRBF0_14165 [Calditrichia bacterium]